MRKTTLTWDRSPISAKLCIFAAALCAGAALAHLNVIRRKGIEAIL